MQDTTSLLGNENLEPGSTSLQGGNGGDSLSDNLFHFVAGLLPFFIQNSLILEIGFWSEYAEKAKICMRVFFAFCLSYPVMWIVHFFRSQKKEIPKQTKTSKNWFWSTKPLVFFALLILEFATLMMLTFGWQVTLDLGNGNYFSILIILSALLAGGIGVSFTNTFASSRPTFGFGSLVCAFLVTILSMIQNVGPTKFDSEIYFGVVVGMFVLSMFIFYGLSRNATDNPLNRRLDTTRMFEESDDMSPISLRWSCILSGYINFLSFLLPAFIAHLSKDGSSVNDLLIVWLLGHFLGSFLLVFIKLRYYVINTVLTTVLFLCVFFSHIRGFAHLFHVNIWVSSIFISLTCILASYSRRMLSLDFRQRSSIETIRISAQVGAFLGVFVGLLLSEFETIGDFDD